MTTRYRFDPNQSRCTVQAFVVGLLSFAGHSPTFVVRDFGGSVERDGSAERNLAVHLSARAGSLELLDRVKDADRWEIEQRLQHEVLETDATPTMVFESEHVDAEALGDGLYRLDIAGWLSLHGVRQPYRIDAELYESGNRLHLRGKDVLAMSDFRIKPVTALGGTIALKDEVALAFDLVAVPEDP